MTAIRLESTMNLGPAPLAAPVRERRVFEAAPERSLTPTKRQRHATIHPAMSMKPLCAGIAVAGLVLALGSERAVCAAPPVVPAAPPGGPAVDVTFPISIAVVVEDGAPARDDAWITAQIEDANALYAPLGVRFRWSLRREIPATHAQLHSRADRDALAPLVESNVIDVFVVAALEDVDEPGRYRKGVAWTSKPNGKRFLILSAAAPRTVLAHELGHFFGNGHTDVADNLMSYTRTQGGQVFLDEAQIERTRLFASRFLASGRLRDIGPGRVLP